MPILNDTQNELLRAERRALAGLQVALAGLDATPDDLATLQEAILQLDALFLIVVVGEFNAGKSALINALLGQPLLPEGVTPTTSRIQVLVHGETSGERGLEEGLVQIAAPVAFLQEIQVVDTPGTNAIIRRHEQLTQRFVPRSDLVLFVTSADRPFTESERVFLEAIRQWGKKVVFLVNKADLLEGEVAVQEVLNFVRENARPLLGQAPVVLPVSARLALKAKASDDPVEKERLWARSRFQALEEYIFQTLDQAERLRLKLSNPLGVGQKLVSHYLIRLDQRQERLTEDLETVDNVERQLTLYSGDLRRNFQPRLAEVDNLLHVLERRGNDFFDTTLRLTKVFDLINGERVRHAFEQQVVADTPAQIEKKVMGIIDWLVEQDWRQWQAVTLYLNRRRAVHAEQIVGEVGGSYESHRQELLAQVGEAASRVVASYDRASEARELGLAVEQAVAQVALLEAGAVGLGAAVTIALSSTALDVTGMLAAGAMAIIGLLIIPHKRQQARARLHQKIGDLRQRLMQVLTDEFDRAAGRSLERLREAVSPYTRFVRAEQDRLNEQRASLTASQVALAALQDQVERL